MSDVKAAESSAPLLRAENLVKTYVDGDVRALRGVSLEVRRGESVAIVGPSGCGKSTLLHLLGGLDHPTSGEIFYEGTPLSKVDLDQYRSRELGFVFQSFYLMPTLSAVENVQVPMFESSYSAAQRAERATQLVEMVGLSHRLNQSATRLSVGERQRIAIARALANKPSLLLADEPTGNLDTHNQAEILRLLEELRQKQGLTLLIVTHSNDVANAADRVIHMKDGEIVQDVSVAS